jgi:hypothetical protein
MKHFLAGALVELVKLFAAAHAAAISRKGARQAERMAREAKEEANTVELELLRARLERLDSAKRPRYLPQERLRILLSLIERFWRTLKSECLHSTCIWISARSLARKVADYASWFNASRPHQGLQGRTPRDVSAKAERPKPMTVKFGDVLRVSRRQLHGDPKLPLYTLGLRKSA